ncbi:hypothetical protein M4951_14605 [Blastopirellula sp. J2-11]|uniref:hypothetical protein n=1 Tax=Blastopirellula sp. J2-11 TaxID=2943192 RepID=UPI0021C9C248|nr:hypothetical protein [Blastopirellula sp. J2-11]UUO04621.1 hypothetical protein M4951_14605 [Blastopirellula sp. J2-11]
MALFVWRGDAQGRAQVCDIVADNIEIGDDFTLTLNGVEFVARSTNGTAGEIYALLQAAIEAVQDLPKLAGLTIEIGGEFGSGLVIIGADDGRPFLVETLADNGGVGEISITNAQDPFAGRNEIQQVSLPVGITGGTFTVTFDGQTTSALAYNASAATVQSALEALSNIESGDIAVTGADGGPWLIEFKATYANTNVSAVTVDTSSLTAGSVLVTEIVEGSIGGNAIQRLTITSSGAIETESTLFSIKWRGPGQEAEEVLPFFYSADHFATAAGMKSRLDDHSLIGPTDITVTLVSSTASQRVYDVEFIGTLGGQEIEYPLVFTRSVTGSQTATVDVSIIANGSATGVNEIQTVTLQGSPTGGTFTLTYSGQTTSALAYNADAATVEAALEALSNIGSGDVAVTLDAGVYTIEFQGALATTDVSLLIGDGSSLTGGSGAIDTVQTALSPVNERQAVTLSPGVSGGTFTLTYSGQTTSALAYNASAGTVEAAIEALSNIDAVAVTRSLGGPWIVEFQGSLAATNVATMIGNGGNLTGDDAQSFIATVTTTGTGPHHWDEPANWSQGSLPVDGSDVRIENSASDILYGLDQSAVTLLSLDVRASFTGTIGLPDQNAAGFYEYLPTHLAIGSTTTRIGEGEGSGSPLIRLDNGSAQTSITVYNAGSPASDGYAIDWIGTHASNVMTVYKGTVGVAVGAGEAAVLSSLDVSFVSSRDSDALVYLGDDVTIGDITKDGGELTITGRSGTDITSIQSTAGDVYLRGTDGVESLSVEGGDFYYLSTGTLGGDPAVSGDGQLIFDGDRRAKMATNTINVYGDAADVIDTAEVVNAESSLSIHYQGTTRFSNLGNDIIIARGSWTPSESEGGGDVSITLYAAAMRMVVVAVDDSLETIAAMLTTASYAHPTIGEVTKTAADIIQIDVVAPTADIVVHDADNDTDGQTIVTDGSEFFPIAGADAVALRMVTDSSADVLLKIYYS